jgi:hypothetical protein
MSNLLKTLNKSGNGSEKFNPDISNLYNNANETRQTTNYKFSTEGYKTIINEKITKPIKDDTLKEKILDIDFDNFYVRNTATAYVFCDFFENFINNTEEEFNILMEDYRVHLENQTLEFFYSPKNYGYENTEHNIIFNTYLMNQENKLKQALNIPKILKGFSNYIYVLDKPNNNEDMEILPRYKKMKRLEFFYNLLIQIGLKIIHALFWEDLKNNKTSLLTIKECLKMASPIIINLKHKFEDIVKEEFEYDENEEKLIYMGRIYK